MFYDGAARADAVGRPKPALGAAHAGTDLTLDLGPSLLSMANAKPMIETDGEDLWPALQGLATVDPERPIVSQLANRKAHQLPTAMLRQADMLVCHGVDDHRPQLFDLSADPHEPPTGANRPPSTRRLSNACGPNSIGIGIPPPPTAPQISHQP